MTEDKPDCGKELSAKTQESLRAYGSEFARAAIETANGVIKTLILINGGAVIAVLAFLSAVLPSGELDASKDFSFALMAFSVGVALAAASMIGAYFVNFMDFRFVNAVTTPKDNPFSKGLLEAKKRDRQRKFRNSLRVMAVASCVFSLFGFCAGVYFSSVGIFEMSSQSRAIVSVVADGTINVGEVTLKGNSD